MESQTTLTAGVVAPFWLHEPLGVLVQAAPGVIWAGCTTTVEALLSAPAEEPPDLVLLYAANRLAASQVGEVKGAWPHARCIVLVEDARHQAVALKAGADLVLLEGLAPGRLLETLDRLRLDLDYDRSEGGLSLRGKSASEEGVST